MLSLKGNAVAGSASVAASAHLRPASVTACAILADPSHGHNNSSSCRFANSVGACLSSRLGHQHPAPVRTHRAAQRSNRLLVKSVPSPEIEEARSPLDAPQEWQTPQPSKRPDIFPEFEKMDRVFLPKPLPGDPEMPDEEEEESKKRTTPGDPDPEQKPGEEPEVPKPKEPETEPSKEPESPGTDIPTIPE